VQLFSEITDYQGSALTASAQKMKTGFNCKFKHIDG
jgi:hypothetical protein